MADTVGNRLGPRGTFVYTSDSLVEYNISLDRSVSIAVGNTLSTDAALPNVRASGNRPIEPRYFLLALTATPTIKKKAIVCDADNTTFAADGASTLTINGVSWTVTGRVGEKRSSVRLTP